MKSYVYKISIFCCVFVLLVGSFVIPAFANDFVLSPETPKNEVLNIISNFLNNFDLSESDKSEYLNLFSTGYDYYPYFFAFSRSNSIYFILSLEPIYLNIIKNTIHNIIPLRISGNSIVHYYNGSISRDSFTDFMSFASIPINSSSDDILTFFDFEVNEYSKNYVTNHDISLSPNDLLPSSYSNEVFFYPESIPQPIVSQQQMTTAMKTILTRVAGLVPSLVVLLTVSIGLRKGWMFLKTQLRGA